jgi:hypothetical protein
VYLFRSPTLPTNPDSYVSWEPATETATAVSYTLAFDHANFFGIADLSINGGGIDVLDRQKVRGSIGIFTFNEENLAGVITAPIQFAAQGPVRLATGSGSQRLEVYGRGFKSALVVDTTNFGLPLSAVRTSLDLNNPDQTGLVNYFDSNSPGGVPIDGVQDTVPATPLVEWFQDSGGAAGPGGLVVIWEDIDPGGGTATNFYLDDASSNDPGDGAAYGDAGIHINAPGEIISLTLAAFVLPPGTEVSRGAELFAWFQNPLETSVEIQALEPPYQVHLPVVHRQ